jgi:hypothetical protein
MSLVYIGKGYSTLTIGMEKKLELLQHPLGANYSKDKIYIADA